MGSLCNVFSSELEEQELMQMVRDFIESESSSPSTFASSRGLTLYRQSINLTLQDVLGDVEVNEPEIHEKIFDYLRKRNSTGKTANLKKWLVMRLRMDGFDASVCRTSWPTTFNSPGGDYEYIDIMLQDNKGVSRRLIVDIDFKSQFELVRPTSFYTQLSDTLPLIFVGSEAKLDKIISILCTAAKESLKERGLHVPPWRKTSYMQSKWLSDCQKVLPTPCTKSKSNSNSDQGNGGATATQASSQYTKWAPPAPIVKPDRRELGRGSGLSSQFSSLSINCC